MIIHVCTLSKHFINCCRNAQLMGGASAMSNVHLLTLVFIVEGLTNGNHCTQVRKLVALTLFNQPLCLNNNEQEN